MLCEEVREQLKIGNSLYLQPSEHSSYVDEVDYHLEDCSECLDAVVRGRKRLFWQRPGLLHLLRLGLMARRIRQKQAIIRKVKAEGFSTRADESPIARVTAIILEKAIMR